MTPPLLAVDGLSVRYPGRGRRRLVHAVTDVSFEVHEGETVALVGESGCGKSSVARAVAGIQSARSGRVLLRGVHTGGLRGGELARARRSLQMIYQDPYDSLDPRLTVDRIVAEGLEIHRVPRAEHRERVRRALGRVGLVPEDAIAARYPHELSGGQRQRVAIAAAIVLEPALIVADEPVSMLDVSVRASVLALLDELRRQGLGILYITHDLASAATHADRIVVMYAGRIVEEGPARIVLRWPAHPYTRALLSAIPSRDPSVPTRPEILPGEVPDPAHPVVGCAFAPRCVRAAAACRVATPPLEPAGPARRVACSFPLVSDDA